MSQNIKSLTQHFRFNTKQTIKTHLSTPLLLGVAVVIAACSSAPTTTSLLEDARSDYVVAQNNPNVASYAPLELKQAGDALSQANIAANKQETNEQVDKLAYLAKQKIALSQEIGKQKAAEASVATTAKERDQLRLDQRTAQADQATSSANRARMATQVAQSQTADAVARNAVLEGQLADLSAKKTARGYVVTLSDVLFGTDLSRLNADGIRTVQKLVEVLNKNPLRNVLIEGFTDSTGSVSHNQELSERRASAVQQSLLDLGVSATRITTRGYGETYPVAANDTSANRQLNRRVEIVLSEDNGQVLQR